jgi:hypothetical protein
VRGEERRGEERRGEERRGEERRGKQDMIHVTNYLSCVRMGSERIAEAEVKTQGK